MGYGDETCGCGVRFAGETPEIARAFLARHQQVNHNPAREAALAMAAESSRKKEEARLAERASRPTRAKKK